MKNILIVWTIGILKKEHKLVDYWPRRRNRRGYLFSDCCCCFERLFRFWPGVLLVLRSPPVRFSFGCREFIFETVGEMWAARVRLGEKKSCFGRRRPGAKKEEDGWKQTSPRQILGGLLVV
jgi:hypothetical protein